MILDEAKKAALSASVAPVEVTPQPGALMIRCSTPARLPRAPSSSPSPFSLRLFPAKARSDDRAVCQAPCCSTTCFGAHGTRSFEYCLSPLQSTPRLSSLNLLLVSPLLSSSLLNVSPLPSPLSDVHPSLSSLVSPLFSLNSARCWLIGDRGSFPACTPAARM